MSLAVVNWQRIPSSCYGSNIQDEACMGGQEHLDLDLDLYHKSSSQLAALSVLRRARASRADADVETALEDGSCDTIIEGEASLGAQQAALLPASHP